MAGWQGVGRPCHWGREPSPPLSPSPLGPSRERGKKKQRDAPALWRRCVPLVRYWEGGKDTPPHTPGFNWFPPTRPVLFELSEICLGKFLIIRCQGGRLEKGVLSKGQGGFREGRCRFLAGHRNDRGEGGGLVMEARDGLARRGPPPRSYFESLRVSGPTPG